MADITVIGSLIMDNVARVDRFPKDGETVLGKSLNFFPGGKGANQCVSIARLGGDVEMIGMLGRDANGDVLRNILKKEKIDCENVFSCDKPTAIAQIQIDKDGQNRICVIPSANYEFGMKEVKKIDNVLKNTKLVVLQLEIRLDVIKEIVFRCHKYGVKVLLNPAPAVKLEKNVLGLIDYLTPNETELSILTGITINNDKDAILAANKLLSYGVKCVVATLGSRGALIVKNNYSKFIPAYKVDVVDTVGAGDSFNGAFAVALIEGKTLDEAVMFATAMGALTVQIAGAISSMHNRDEVEMFIKSHN